MTGLPHVSLRRHAAVLAACIAIAFLPGMFGAAFPPGEWYAGLTKPALTPPGFVFPIAWTLLYLTIGISLFVFRVATEQRRAGYIAFAIQLVLNGAWSAIFFGAHAPGAALVEIVLLWLSIAATIAVFARHSRAAAKLLLPYLAWVGFATYLNASIWRAS